jgi:hypothetical protein
MGANMSQQEIDYRAIRRRAETDLAREKSKVRLIFFLTYLALFAVFMVFGWGLYLANGGTLPQPNIPGVSRETNPVTVAMSLLSAVGFMGLIFQFVSLILDTKIGERQLRERAMGRVMSAEMKRMGIDDEDMPHEKAKRLVRLGDDGELEEADPDDESLMNDETPDQQQGRA